MASRARKGQCGHQGQHRETAGAAECVRLVAGCPHCPLAREAENAIYPLSYFFCVRLARARDSADTGGAAKVQGRAAQAPLLL